MHLVEWVIPEDLACQILAESAPDSVFSIGQERFNSLPNTCEGNPEQEYKGIAGRIEDASTTTILEYLTGTKRKIQFYGAETYYAVCYPYQKEFVILRPLLNTFKVLEKYVKERDVIGHINTSGIE